MTNERTALNLVTPAMMGVEEVTVTDKQIALLPDTMKNNIEQRVSALVKEMKDAQFEIPDKILNEIQQCGNMEIQQSTDNSNRLLKVPMQNSMQAVKEGSPVAKNLTELTQIMRDLDPSRKRKLLGMIPFTEKIETYLRRWESSESQLNEVIDRLRSSSQELALDNQAMLVEQDNIRESVIALAKYIYMSDALVAQLTELHEEAEQDPATAGKYRDALFYAQQKNQDLKMHARTLEILYLGMRQTISNNTELHKSVERACTTTVTALRGAVLMNNAQANGAHVVQQVDAVNKMTGDLLVSATESMKQNAADIQRQANSTSLKIEDLRKSYLNIQEALERAEDSRTEAISTMNAVITELDSGFGTGNSRQIEGKKTSAVQQKDENWLTIEG